MVVNLISEWVLPTAVIVSAAATTSSAVIAWHIYRSVQSLDRAVFGGELQDGLVSAVNDNTKMTDENRRILRKHDLVDGDQEIGQPADGRWRDQ